MRLPVPSPARPIVFVTGAGISAASGIPTFRGPEGYWTVGSRRYQPQEMATQAAFRSIPREVWRWYLYRRGVCRAAEPNAAHHALVTLERELGDGFRLVTQNVDGLHARAGHDPSRVAAVHGDLDQMRDVATDAKTPMPPELVVPDRDTPVDDETWARLVHPETGGRCRPHVLWFDEYYDEALYQSDTAIMWARAASTLVVVGTSGAARIPWLCAEAALLHGAVLVDVNPDDNPFRELAAAAGDQGWVVPADAVDGVARVVAALGPRSKPG